MSKIPIYLTGLIIGRFQGLHNGHQELILRALELCDTVVVYVGSAQESRTLTNPFSYDLRREMLVSTFEDVVEQQRLIIRPLTDIGVGHNNAWGQYVMDTFEKEFSKLPELYISGCEKSRLSWFSDELASQMDELRISREFVNVSGSQCRALLRAGNKEEWCRYVPQEVWPFFDRLASIVQSIPQLDPIWVYRFEHTDPNKGAWYNRKGVFCCTHPVLKQLDMPYEPDVYRVIYRSACKNGEDLTYWIPREVGEDMLRQGYQLTKYFTRDYFMRDHGEVCFNYTNFIEKKNIDLDEIYKKDTKENTK